MHYNIFKKCSTEKWLLLTVHYHHMVNALLEWKGGLLQQIWNILQKKYILHKLLQILVLDAFLDGPNENNCLHWNLNALIMIFNFHHRLWTRFFYYVVYSNILQVPIIKYKYYVNFTSPCFLIGPLIVHVYSRVSKHYSAWLHLALMR